MHYETTALAVANYFIRFYSEEETSKGYPLDNLRLNKLVYISYGVVYGYLKKRLYGDRIEAWRYGPVIPSVYHVFKCNGYSPIQDEVYVLNDDEGKLDVSLKEVRECLDAVMNAYNDTESVVLIERTHSIGSPWWYALQGKVGEKGVEIEKKMIEEYYYDFGQNKK